MIEVNNCDISQKKNVSCTLSAFHTVWSAPSALKDDFCMKDYDLLVMALSALYWRRNNGKISLFADEYVVRYLDRMNMIGLWDKIEVLPYYLGINPYMYWAGAKLFALRKADAPVVMMDTDLIVWKKLKCSSKSALISQNQMGIKNANMIEISSSKVCVAHCEPIIGNVYKPREYFVMKKHFDFDRFSWEVMPSNTAFLYISDAKFKDYYVDTATDFMQSSCDTSDSLSYMVFAEQRLLSMCAFEKNIAVDCLISFPHDIGNQDTLTHVWGYKKILEQNDYERMKFCKRCVNRLKKDFPEQSDTFLKNPEFEKYV